MVKLPRSPDYEFLDLLQFVWEHQDCLIFCEFHTFTFDGKEQRIKHGIDPWYLWEVIRSASKDKLILYEEIMREDEVWMKVTFTIKGMWFLHVHGRY
jgi:hypothetical protein